MAKIALLIGVSDYEPALNPLPAAIKDVDSMHRVLQSAEMGGFDEVKILKNPDPQTMQYEIETLFAGRSKDDLLLLFFSGHGIKDDSNNLYFATPITRKTVKGELIRSTAVPSRFVHDVMNNSRAKRQALILDCCFSGAFDPSLQTKDDGSVDLQGQLGAEGRVVLTSSSSTQYSFAQENSELSLYTRYLVEGIETGAGDRDEDGKVSIRELHEYATGKVQETAPNMTPKLITLKDMGFEIVLAKAKIADHELRYRRLVEKYASRGAISAIGRRVLDTHRDQLGLSAEIVKEIEKEVLRPYQLRLENLQKYKQAFSTEIQNEYPLSTHARSELDDWREILGLRKEDVASIEEEFAKVEPPNARQERVVPEKDNSTEMISPEVLPQYRTESVMQPKDGVTTQPVQPKITSLDESRYQQESSNSDANLTSSLKARISRANFKVWQWGCGFLFIATLFNYFASLRNAINYANFSGTLLNWTLVFFTTLFLAAFRPIPWTWAVAGVVIPYSVFLLHYWYNSFIGMLIIVTFTNSLIVGFISFLRFQQITKN
ncbi:MULTISPECIES: caspase family protein [Nostoc]|uniref:Caspase family protein n=2 Tax=Nostoc TaxID=1177 RepID=A0ABR8IC76_9NOSO|nr:MULTISPECIES: caspase family protein [Nostoc]MBD2564158.1 caspase family protein [Nostoc linckia FACHB-391]MBD2648522.1 caspase family protein [Nostoc foliaceum FACHB-393]